MKNNNWIQILLISSIIIIAAFSRLLPHMHNFSPVLGMALFGAAYLKRNTLAFVIPLSAIILSDFVLQRVVYPDYELFYEGWYFQYFAYGLVILAGLGLFKKVTVGRVLLGAFSAAIIFFVVSNFGSWIVLPEYVKTPAGLVQAYIAGIPFFKGTIYSSLLFTSLLFGSYYLISHYILPQVAKA